MNMLRTGLFIAIFPLWLGTVLAQSPAPSPTPSYSESKTYVPRKSKEKEKERKQSTDQPVTNADATMTIAVAVYDSDGHHISGLQSSDFSVFVDGTEVEVTAMKEMPESVELVLLLDKSASAELSKDLIQMIAYQIVDRIGPQDKVSVVGFDDSPKVVIERSSDKTAISKAIKKLGRGDGTSLHDALVKLANARQGGHTDPAALIIVSDAVDTTSKHKYQESLAAVERTNLVVFSIFINTLPDAIANARQFAAFNIGKSFDLQVKEFNAQYKLAADYVNDIITLSGGLVFNPAGEVDIAREMRNRCYLTVRLPKDLTPNERHAFTVRVKRPGLHILSKATLLN
jgi:VWFA-related protein